MKTKILTIVTLLSVVIWPVLADEPMKMPMDMATPPASWPTLEQQGKDLASAIQSHNVHPIHKIDHAVSAETAELQKNAPALPTAQKQKLDELLADMAKQSHRAHMDGHAAKWDDAAVAQKQFTADLREAKAILPSAK